jgi:hypothetical protein
VTYLTTIVGTLTFLATLASADFVHAQKCGEFDTSKRTGEIANDDVDEASGLAASWRHDGLLWTHNDSGGSARLFLMKQDGSHVATVNLKGVADATDWEDMAVGPCAPPSKGDSDQASDADQKGATKSCVYVADIGDNRAGREQVAIHRFEEPGLPDKLPADVSVQVNGSFEFRYPGGPRDAEALMVHPKTAALYVVDKRIQGNSGVYRVPRSSHAGNQKNSDKKPALAVELGQLRLDASLGFGSMITAGDFSPDGTELSVRTYLAVYTFCAKSADVEAIIGADPSKSSPPFMLQSEALGYDRSGRAIWMTSERRPSPVYRMVRTNE